MIDIIKKVNNKYPFLKWLFVFIIIGIPLIIGILISLIPFGVGDDNSWLSFWGVWLGAIIGSSVSILGIYFTLQYNEKQFNQTMNDNRTQYEEDRVISLMPHLKLFVSNIDGNRIVYFNNSTTEAVASYGGIQRNDIRITLKNIGIGSSLGIKFKIGNHLGTVPFEVNDIALDLGVNEAENIMFSLFDMGEKYYDLELEYTDILGRHIYKQSGTIHNKGAYNSTIIMNSIKTQT